MNACEYGAFHNVHCQTDRVDAYGKPRADKCHNVTTTTRADGSASVYCETCRTALWVLRPYAEYVEPTRPLRAYRLARERIARLMREHDALAARYTA